MGIEDLKRWHWVVVGALVGVALSYAWVSMGMETDTIRSVDEGVFENELLMQDSQSNQPLISGIVIRPVEKAFKGTSQEHDVNVVTYKRLAKDKQGRIGWLDRRLVAKVPYKPANPGRILDSSNLTIQTYLQQIARQNNQVRYNYGWWLEPKKAMVLGCIGGMVLIGGVWPTLLNVMLGAGFGRQRDPEEEARKQAKSGFDWGSLVRRAKSAQPVAAHAGASVAGQRELEGVAAAYEKNLAGSGVGHTDTPLAAEPNSRLVRKLEGGPLEEAKPLAKPGDDDEIEVKGEYYPVLIHHKKHHEEQPATGEANPPTDGALEKK
jgi:hypothetical protein